MWIAGWIYQAIFFQWDGILNGLGGFGLGFGLFFVLWIIGSAGGGDVKLMGALSVWLGGSLTLKVIGQFDFRCDRYADISDYRHLQRRLEKDSQTLHPCCNHRTAYRD